MPPSPKDLPIIGQSQPQSEEQMLRQRMGEVRHKLLVLSGKGGVGKSTVAVSLARALARAGKQVGLLDVDVHGPSIPGLMGLKSQQLQIIGEEILPVKVGDNLAVVSIGFLLPTGREPVVLDGPPESREPAARHPTDSKVPHSAEL